MTCRPEPFRFRPLFPQSLAVVGLAALALPAFGADADDEREPLGISVRVAGRALFNVKGSVIDTKAPLGAGARFDDGFVLPDSSGSATDTWHWGYENASQVVNGGSQLEFHRLDNSPRPGSFELGGGSPVFGGELILGFEAFRFDWGSKEAKFGAELGYGYMPYSSTGSARLTANSTYTTTLYNLGGITPPPPGYAGPFNGPGAVIPLNPAAPATTLTGSGTGAVDSAFDVNMHTMRLGLWIEYPLTRKVSLTGAIGYSAVFADGELRLTESLAFANAGMPSQAAVTSLVSKTDWLQGAYLEARANWHLTKTISAFVGGEVRLQTDFELQSGNRLGQLEFGVGFAGTLGLQFDF